MGSEIITAKKMQGHFIKASNRLRKSKYANLHPAPEISASTKRQHWKSRQDHKKCHPKNIALLALMGLVIVLGFWGLFALN